MVPIFVKYLGKERIAYVIPFRKEDTPFPYLYEQAMKLREEEGMNARQIAIKLRMRIGTVGGWIYNGVKPRGRQAGYVIKIGGKWKHIQDPDIEFLHPDWELFVFEDGITGHLLPSRMNFELANV